MRLLTPGPVPVSREVAEAIGAPLIHHRTQAFEEALQEVRANLSWICQTEEPTVVLTGSGTTGMEAALVSLSSPGVPMVCVGGGKFGERWGEIGRAYGQEVIDLKVLWGEAVRPEVLEAVLARRPDVGLVAITASETSTGVWHPLKEVCEVVKRSPGRLILVDGITAVGVHEVAMDRWGIDAVVMGSQKVFGLPPGLAMVAVRRESLRAAKGLPSYGLDLRRELKAQEKGQTAFTPATALVLGLRVALRSIRAEGLEASWARHAQMGRLARYGMDRLGLWILGEGSPSEAVTAGVLPEGVDGERLVERVRALGVALAEGQSGLAGRVVRMGHLGTHTEDDVREGLRCLQIALREMA